MSDTLSAPRVEPAATTRRLQFLTKPLTVRIGVTGHRVLEHPERLRRSVRKILAEIDACLGEALQGYKIISALAEGADRLVAECVIGWKGSGASAHLPAAQLEVVLPMARHDYIETFRADHRQESIEEFQRLLDFAGSPRHLPKVASHDQAYEQLGGYLVSNCDVIITIWDGKPARGRGGTADVVKMAQAKDRTVFWIHASTGRIRRLPNRRDFVSQISFLNEYNRESADEATICREVDERLHKLRRQASEKGMDPEILNPLGETVLPHFVKAEHLALRYQWRHFWPTTAAYILSACAVGTAAVLGFLFHGSRSLFLIEAVEIGCVIALAWPPTFRLWQRKWIDYRYLAERLRAACFLYAVGLREETSEAPPDMQISSLPDNWVVIALREVWQSLPPLPFPHGRHTKERLDESTVANFLVAAWIDPQRNYYEKASHANHHAHKRLEFLLTALIGSTLAAAVLHIVVHETSWLPEVLSVLAVTLPALASALAGISIFRHFSQNAERYLSMSHYLKEIGERISSHQPADHSHSHTGFSSSLQRLVREADRAMAHEHQGWRVVFGTHLPGPG